MWSTGEDGTSTRNANSKEAGNNEEQRGRWQKGGRHGRTKPRTPGWGKQRKPQAVTAHSTWTPRLRSTWTAARSPCAPAFSQFLLPAPCSRARPRRLPEYARAPNCTRPRATSSPHPPFPARTSIRLAR